MKLTSIFGLLLFAFTAYGQIYTPVKWSFSQAPVEGDVWEITFTGTLDDGWYVYSQFQVSDDGPLPTTISYNKGNHYSLVGKSVESGNKKTGHDEMFDMVVTKFAKKFIIKQKVKVTDASKPVTGTLEYQTCDDSKCLPPEPVDFSFKFAKTPSTGQAPVPGQDPAGGSSVAAGTQLPAAPNSNNASATRAGDPVTWIVSANPKGNGQYELVFRAEMKQGWYLYGQKIKGTGPIPTTIAFNDTKGVTKVGTPKEAAEKSSTEKVPEFDNAEVTKLKGWATFTQVLKVAPGAAPLAGTVDFMTCEEGKCIPGELLEWEVSSWEPLQVTVKQVETDIAASGLGSTPTSGTASNIPAIYPAAAANIDYKNPASNCNNTAPPTNPAQEGLLKIFFLGFVGGLIGLLTPCVFPMIPLTVSFFTKGSENRKKGISKSILYGAFILLVYLLLSLPFHLLDSISPDILNEISTNVWLNLFFFITFLFFAFSFFGYYELTLPSSWTNRTSSAEGIGGVIGIFFMALTLAIVSFSCTGPILGSLLAGSLSSNGGAMQLTAGMGGFGLALALPFALFAAFPSMLGNLPKSGGWLNSVKVVLGFAEIALAFKFLSNADLVKHWGIVKYELFMGVWIICGLAIVAYLLGWIRFPHDSKMGKITPTRWAFIGLFTLIAAYLISGFRYKEEEGTFHSLSLMSGLAPPVGYSWLYPKACPSGIDCFHDLESGIAASKQTGKPILIDFTGYACVNCRKMEEHVWSTGKILPYLKEKYILVSLYVDDKRELPANEQVEVVSKYGKKRKLKTYGNKWAFFQTEYFDNNSQPWYGLVTPDLKVLTTPVGYTPDVEEYASFLQCGLDEFNKMNSGK